LQRAYKKAGKKERKLKEEWEKKSRREKGFLRVLQAQACTIQPLRTWRNTRAMKTVMSGLKNCNANAIVHKTTNY